jgi:gas vesicle protein
VGGGIGAAVALLFAPKSGTELRNDISEIGRLSYDETLDLAHQLKDQSAQLYQSIKEKADSVYGLAADRFAATTEAPVNGELLDLPDEFGPNTATMSHKPTNIV